ncbi:MAG: DUF1353 domain-containing protein [Betaproteobacteria bacterium]|nr:DUF1353 domain-containing protein [Betaproteobacteria bacterium]
MVRTLLSCVLWLTCLPVRADVDPHFAGRLVLEIPEDVSLAGRMRLVQDYTFVDGRGRRWTAARGSVVEGALVPSELRGLPLLAPDGQVRRAAVLRDAIASAGTEAWHDVARMFFEANLAEDVSRPQAKLLYMAWRAGGRRWEPHGSSCYGSCHAAVTLLTWKPDLRGLDFRPVIDWIWREDPSLDAIDDRLGQLIHRPGPHLFAQQPQ